MADNTPASDVTDPVEATIDNGELAASQETSLGPDENVVGALAYILGVISGLAVYFLEKENEFARFHAAQSIVFSVGVIGFYVAMTFLSVLFTFVLDGIPIIGWILSIGMTMLSLVLWFGFFLIWLYLLITAFQGKQTRLPVVADLAEKHLL